MPGHRPLLLHEAPGTRHGPHPRGPARRPLHGLPPGTPADSPVRPGTGALAYPGPAAFHEDEAVIFFGRAARTTEAMRRLNGVGADPHERFLAVIGASGSGKSSLVQAGLLPRLRN
ncbi:nSTAND1 domain-containing NTPase [Nocardiopsis dassonvillei]|uniref:nSTAND1 domain-containing NTPase n=1 Tax=Nocardiopsis dassonvillei TaxID=2014 RepID=UPI003557EEAF